MQNDTPMLFPELFSPQDIPNHFLTYMAWRIQSIEKLQALDILRQMGATITLAQKIWKNLIDQKQLLCIDDLFYILSPQLHLSLLWELKDVPGEPFKRYFQKPSPSLFPYHKEWAERLRIVLFYYARQNTNMPYSFKEDYQNTIARLCFEMFYHAKWKDILPKLPVSLLNAAFLYQEKLRMWNLIFPDENFLREVYLENPYLPDPLKKYYQEACYFDLHIMPGHIDKACTENTFSSGEGKCITALCLQYQDQDKEAVKIYQQLLKEKGEHFFYHPFFDLMYIQALIRENSSSSRKKLDSLQKKRELYNALELLPARLLLSHHLQQKTDIGIEYIEKHYQEFPPLILLLVMLVVLHYQMKEDIAVDYSYLDPVLHSPSYRLLQLEGSSAFPCCKERKDELEKELGLKPIFQPYHKLPVWQETLNQLNELAQRPLASSPNSPSQTRIIYCINEYKQITPRLQKSKDGVTWSAGRNIALSTFSQKKVEGMNAIDTQLAACVKAYSSGWGRYEYYELDSSEAFPILAGYPLVFQESNPAIPVVIEKEELQITIIRQTGGYEVRMNVTPPIDKKVYIQRENDQLYRVVQMDSWQMLLFQQLERVPVFPPEAKKELAGLLGNLSKHITIHSDLLQSGSTLKTVKADTLITVRLQPSGNGIQAELFVKPFADQPPYCKAGEGVQNVIGNVNGKQVQAVRNLKKEKENLKVVSDALQQISRDKTVTDVVFFDDAYQCLELLDVLRTLTHACRTEWPEGVKYVIRRAVDFSDLKLSLKSAAQWFEVEGELQIDARTQMKISELLRKVSESKGRFIELGDSEFLALSKGLRRQLEEMEVMMVKDKDKMHVSRLNASLLTDLESRGVNLLKDPTFIQLQQRIEQAAQKKFPVPKTLQAELRNYQADGFRWMSRLAQWGAGACLADDMGLGKTIQAIALLLSRGNKGASLVVAPASVLLNWRDEIIRFAPSLTPLVMHHADCDRKKLVEEASDFDIVLTTYGLLVNEAELLAGKQWNVIVLDEAHTIKNKATKMSKAAMGLQGDFRLLLTGTPLQNHLSEIWNLFQFANPGMLGTFQHFSETFILPIEKGENKQRQKQLKKLLLPFLLRRTKSEVLDELPEKTEITVHVELSPEERALYETLRRQALLNLEEKSSTAMQTLTELTRLRQAACHPCLVNKELTLASSKTQAFLNLTDELITNNHRALVFSQFTSHLALIRKELDARGTEYLYLDGSVTVTERTALVKKFQTGEQPLFLISLKAGGLGLNLTAADYVIHLDPWWNPAIEDQASDRAHRIGQSRPVTIYRLIAAQTIEEKIIKLHQTKKSLADSLLDGSNLSHQLTKEQMLELLREGKE